MQGFFTFLQQNPYLLLFFVVGLAVWIGRANIKGYGLGMVAGAIVVGAGLSVWASSYGVKLELNNFAKSLFYYLFMYGVGLRVGPSFINSLKGDGLKFTFLAVVSSVLGLALVVILAKLFALPTGAAGGMLAGSQTMSAAIDLGIIETNELAAGRVIGGKEAAPDIALVGLGAGIAAERIVEMREVGQIGYVLHQALDPRLKRLMCVRAALLQAAVDFTGDFSQHPHQMRDVASGVVDVGLDQNRVARGLVDLDVVFVR